MSIRGYIRRLERANITDVFGLDEPLGKLAGPLLGIAQGGTRLYKELHTHNAIETLQRKNPVTTDRVRIVSPHRHVKHKPEGGGVPVLNTKQYREPSQAAQEAPVGQGASGATVPSPQAQPPQPSAPPVPQASNSNQTIAWGKKVSTLFKQKVIAMAKRLNTDPNWLMAAMAFETMETFSPSIPNQKGSSGIGLIQFMAKTARDLGTTRAALKAMTAEDQLDYVEKYLRAYRKKLNSLENVYMAIIWPRGLNKSNDYVMFSKKSKSQEYNDNSGLDVNGDQQITKAEAAGKVREKLIKGLKPQYVG